MTDITKCPGFTPEEVDCPMRDTCWRYTAPSSNWQSFMHAPLYRLSDDGQWKCDEYWKVTNE